MNFDLYRIIKIAKAKKMTLREYTAYKNRFIGLKVYHDIAEPPKNCGRDTSGYLVGYPGEDGESFIGELPGGCRYNCWVPGVVFEVVSRKMMGENNGK